MSKAGKGDSVDTASVGSQHPVPENIPHLSSPTSSNTGLNTALHHPSVSGQQSGSPVKESSFLHCETNADEAEKKDGKENVPVEEPAGGEAQAIPIRR